MVYVSSVYHNDLPTYMPTATEYLGIDSTRLWNSAGELPFYFFLKIPSLDILMTSLENAV